MEDGKKKKRRRKIGRWGGKGHGKTKTDRAG